MRKNGFTLIELLAVIVILAIIALIATPIILGIINDAREESQERSVELYASAVRNGIAAYQLREMKEVAAGTYTSETLPFDVEYDGEVECTTIDIYEDGGVYVAGCEVNDIPVEYTYGTKQEKIMYLSDVCDPESVATPGAYTAGDKYTCTVDPNKPAYTFYVLNTVEVPENAKPGEVSVNLIMDSNITRTGEAVKEATPASDKTGLVEWITQTDYEREDIGGKAWNDWTDNNTFGPISAMEYLQAATKGWTKVNPQTVETFTDDAGETHNMAIKYTVNARMPYLSEVGATGCDIVNSESGTCPLWMVDHLNEYTSAYPTRTAVSGVYGYWTLSSLASYPGGAWSVSQYGYANRSNVVLDVGIYGVRPVINLSI